MVIRLDRRVTKNRGAWLWRPDQGGVDWGGVKKLKRQVAVPIVFAGIRKASLRRRKQMSVDIDERCGSERLLNRGRNLQEVQQSAVVWEPKTPPLIWANLVSRFVLSGRAALAVALGQTSRPPSQRPQSINGAPGCQIVIIEASIQRN